MTYSPPQFEELADLVWALANDRLDADGAAGLRLLLESDAASRRVYSELMDQFALLEWERGGGEGRGMVGLPAVDASIGTAVEHPVGAAVELPHPSDLEPQIPEPPLPSLSTTHYPLPTSDFVGSWAFSCMVSAVIMGVMLLVFWAMKVTHHQHIAEAPSQSAPSDAMPEMVFVGRITGMVDVKWSDDPRFLPPLSSRAYVPLGRKYILDSGLLEITYDSGAKVILQGPCSYEVESTAGGYLALGKLTARVEKERSEARDQKSDPSPLSPLPSPLFSVRTPTAVVTDLGTEFGVEVGHDGITETQVFVGEVAVVSAGEEKTAEAERHIVRAGQLARVEGKNILVTAVDRAGASDKRFFRALPKRIRNPDVYAKLVLSLQPVAYYRMERPRAEADGKVVFDSAHGMHHGALHNESGLPYLFGRFGDSLNLRGNLRGLGPEIADYVLVPNYPKAVDNQLTVATWVMLLDRSKWNWATIAGNWSHYNLREQLQQLRGQFFFGLYGDDNDLSVIILSPGDRSEIIVREGASKPLPLGQWQHVAFVVDKSIVRLYRNGVEVASKPCDGLTVDSPVSVLSIGCVASDGADATPKSCYWRGRIDELAIFHSALSADAIRRLYRCETPAPPRRFNGKEVTP